MYQLRNTVNTTVSLDCRVAKDEHANLGPIRV